MELKIRSLSWGFDAIQIELKLKNIAAREKKHNIDTWFDCCRNVAASCQMSVDFLVSCEPTIADIKVIRPIRFIRSAGSGEGVAKASAGWKASSFSMRTTCLS